MKVTQIASIVNSIGKEILGQENVMLEDLSNVVDVGKLLLDATDVDNYVKKLLDHIGRVIFVNREYTTILPNILKETWEYGSILEKIDCDMPDASENPQWKLVNGQVYEQDKFTEPKNVRYKLFNSLTTFQIEMSYSYETVKSSFSSPSQLNGFFSMIETKIKNKMTVSYSGLIRSTINSFAAATMYRDFNDKLDNGTHEYTIDKSTVRCVNLISLYRAKGYDTGKTLTPETAITNTDFIKFASYEIALNCKHMQDMSVLFNIGGKERFTPSSKQTLILLADFQKGADVYLQSSTFHNEFTSLPNSESINFWQGTGKNYDFDSISTIHTSSKVTKDGVVIEAAPVESIIKNVIGCLFDFDALGVNNYSNATTSHYNGNGDFYNYWYKSKARYFNDYDENFVLFTLN